MNRLTTRFQIIQISFLMIGSAGKSFMKQRTAIGQAFIGFVGNRVSPDLPTGI